ncbi:Protein of unknown function [Pyronema omphalodes CBS 100304]|uniref:Uncharacterized protein n=1 Tax=Pyronema omphalodes (strain CBS 100304) TaxID=1076935 RepID=U4L8G8_PYROM|nr:Protein of unknown function [Pyronema omphalodes CBS 100304]
MSDLVLSCRWSYHHSISKNAAAFTLELIRLPHVTAAGNIPSGEISGCGNPTPTRNHAASETRFPQRR